LACQHETAMGASTYWALRIDPDGSYLPIEFPRDRVPQVSDLVQSRSPSSVLTCVRDFDGYTVSINPAYQAVLAWSVEELSSVPYWELLHPDDQDRSVEALSRHRHSPLDPIPVRD